MSTFTKARSRKAIVTGAAFLAAGVLVLSGCAADDGGEGGGGTGEDLVLRIGTALPVTGDLAFLGPPEIAGVQYAAAQINEADLGITVEVVEGDSGDLNNTAYVTEVPRLLGEDVAAIIGAASSGVSLQMIDQIIGAGVIQFSPANTSAEFTDYDDDGLFFRTAPSDVLQGEVLGNLIAEDGHETLGMIVLNDSYGTGLAGYTQEAFEAAGGTVVAQPTFNPGDTTFDAQISEVVSQNPDAIALITFDQAETIVPALTAQFPAEDLYFVDGNLANYGDTFPEGTLEGAKGTLPGLSVDAIADFTSALDEFWQGEGNEALGEFSYAAESYDAVMLLALAALEAGSVESADIAAQLQTVSGGAGDGTTCLTWDECAGLVNDGETPDYDGVSGPITFDEVGDPTEATIGTYQYGADNTYVAY